VTTLVVLKGQPTLTTTSTAGTTSPATGTSETWAVAALSRAFPTLTGTQAIALVDKASGATSEIIYVTACSSGATSITGTRGAESTTPIAHTAGATFAASVITKATLDNKSETSSIDGGTP
jgi:hypothetical protein